MLSACLALMELPTTNAYIVNHLTSAYFSIVIFCVMFMYVFSKEKLEHGHIKKGISKNLYRYFYMYAVMLYIALPGTPNVYLVFLIRRLVESLFYRYSHRSRFSVLQFTFAILYYTVLSLYMSNQTIPAGPFLFLNVVQLLCHHLVFIHGYKHIHYLSEALIYLYIFCTLKTLQALLIFSYVALFVSISIKMRCDAEYKFKSPPMFANE